MKVLSEETGFGDVSMLKKSDRTKYFLTKKSIVIHSGNVTIHYVLNELLYKNFFSLITAVTLFMNFCVISEVNT